MARDVIYEEKVSSKRTELIFMLLVLLSFSLFTFFVATVRVGFLTVFFFCLTIFFLFCSLNYKTLVIRITPPTVELRFGIIKWSIPRNTIEQCYLDNTSLLRVGGAGVHFTIIQKKYRAMFNFLEHQRVVLLLSQKKGLVREIAFSTKQADEIQRIIDK